MNKIKMFTDNDLDGVGCSILGKVVYGDKIDVEYCGYNDINKKVKEFINNNEVGFNCEYSFVYITDISVNEEVAEMINDRNFTTSAQDGQHGYRLLDHHKTADWLNKYVWANVQTLNQSISQEGYLESGTSLLYDYFVEVGLILKSWLMHKHIIEFVNQVRMYDTWEWNRLNLKTPKQLNDVFNIVGIQDFVDYHVNRLSKDKTIIPEIISEEQKFLLKYKRKEIEDFIQYKLSKVVVKKDSFGNNAGYVLCDNKNCTSELGSKMLIEFENIDYACIIYDGGFALRSIGNFDVSEIAKKFGGGGHKNAAGYSVNILEKLID